MKCRPSWRLAGEHFHPLHPPPRRSVLVGRADGLPDDIVAPRSGIPDLPHVHVDVGPIPSPSNLGVPRVVLPARADLYLPDDANGNLRGAWPTRHTAGVWPGSRRARRARPGDRGILGPPSARPRSPSRSSRSRVPRSVATGRGSLGPARSAGPSARSSLGLTRRPRPLGRRRLTYGSLGREDGRHGNP